MNHTLRSVIEEELQKAYERGVQDGMKQERALWRLAEIGQDIELGISYEEANPPEPYCKRCGKKLGTEAYDVHTCTPKEPEPAECDGGQCGIGGYCKQCPKPQQSWCKAMNVCDSKFDGCPDKPNNAFNPDWDAMAVMVEEHQRMAKWIEELAQLVTSQGIRLMDAEKEWVGLTKEEANKLQLKYQGKPISLSAAVENLLREKNNGQREGL